MNFNDRLAIIIGRLVMQNEASAEQIEALTKKLEPQKTENANEVADDSRMG